MTKRFDAASRRRRTVPTSTGKRVTLQMRDYVWLKKLHQHGPLPSSYLLAFAKHKYRSEKRAKERLTDLFNEDNTPENGTYLSRPAQQFRTIDSRYNQLVYDLTAGSQKALKQTRAWDQRQSHSAGPWLHTLMVSCITASIELAAADRSDLTFIPQSKILRRAETQLRFHTQITNPSTGDAQGKMLIPDALFGLEYHTQTGSKFRFFLVEADRATEPATSKNFNRKSFLRNLLQYESYIGEGRYKDHLKLTSPLLVLTVANDTKRSERMIKVVETRRTRGNSYLLFQSWEDFGPLFKPPRPNIQLLSAAWKRAGLSDFHIDRP